MPERKDTHMQTGIYTPLITPFNAEGALDLRALDNLLSLYQQSGVSGLIVFSEWSEAHTLYADERERILQLLTQCGLPFIIDISTQSNEIKKALAKQAEHYCANTILCDIKQTHNRISETFVLIEELAEIFTGNIHLHVTDDLAKDHIAIKKLVRMQPVRSIMDDFSDPNKLSFCRRHYGKYIQQFCSTDFLSIIDTTSSGIAAIYHPFTACFAENAAKLFKQVSHQQYKLAIDQLDSYNALVKIFSQIDTESVILMIKWLLAREGIIEEHTRIKCASMNETLIMRIESALHFAKTT